MNKLRIVLAEDHETVREGIKLLVNSQNDMEVIGEAGNGELAIKKVLELSPDIIVMDISMPQLNGLNATKKIKQNSPQTKILTLTRHADNAYLQQIIQAGANGYVLKQSAPTELINAIRAVGAGNSYLDQTLTGKVMKSFISRSSKNVLRGENSTDMTEREADVLRHIAWGYSNKEIAVRLEVSVKTIEAHKANAMRKMDMQSRIDIVRYAILQGWLQDN